MSDPSDAPSGSSWPIITSGGLISPWTRMRRSHGRHNRQPAARSSKSRTSAGSITTTNAAPPDHRLRAARLGRHQNRFAQFTQSLPTGHGAPSVDLPPFSHCPSEVATRFSTPKLRAGDPDDGEALRGADGVSDREGETAQRSGHLGVQQPNASSFHSPSTLRSGCRTSLSAQTGFLIGTPVR
jgi:hypothetical protein